LSATPVGSGTTSYRCWPQGCGSAIERTSQEHLRPDEIAELRHRDAAKRERRRASRRATGSMLPYA
jgi:hypothetical protein